MTEIRMEAETMPVSDRRKPIRSSTVTVLLISVIGALFFLMIAYSIGWGKYLKRMETVSSTDVFRSFECETLTGERFTDADMKQAEITMFNIWATDCPPCIKELPELEQINQGLDHSRIQVIGIVNDAGSLDSRDEVRIEEAKRLLSECGVTFRSLIPETKMKLLIRSILVGTPTSVFVNRDGEIIRTVIGAKNAEQWKSIIREVTEEVHAQ